MPKTAKGVGGRARVVIPNGGGVMGAIGATGATGPGGSPTGDPNAIAYFNPTGAAITDDPKLTAAPIDQFGRPQIRDIRQNGPTGPVFRQGAWMADGDATNVISEGLVFYGAAPNGIQDAANGTFARVKPTRFAIRLIMTAGGGGDIGFAYRTDLDTMPGAWSSLVAYGAGATVTYQGTAYTSLVGGNLGNTPPTPPATTAFWVQTDSAGGTYWKNNAGAKTARVDRATGDAFFSTVRVGGGGGPSISSGAGMPNGVVTGSPGDLYLNTLGGAGTTLWVKEAGIATNVGWVGK